MPIDPRIALQVNAPHPIDVGRGFRLRALLDQETRKQEEHRLKMAAAERGAAKEKGVREAFSAAGGDPEKALPGVTAVDPTAGMELRKIVSKLKDDELTRATDTLKNSAQQIGMRSQILASVTDQASYDQARADLDALEPGVSGKMPAQWNPQYVAFQIGKGKTLAQRATEAHNAAIEEQNRRRDELTSNRADRAEMRDIRTAEETARHNKATEANAAGRPSTDTRTANQKDYQQYKDEGGKLGFDGWLREQANLKRPAEPRGFFQPIMDENGIVTSFYNPATRETSPAPTGARRAAVPPAVREKAATIAGTIADVDELERLANANSGSIGRIAGNVAAAKRWLVGAGPEVNEIFRIADNLADQLLRARSGAAITEKEYARLRALVPDPRGPKDKFDSDLKGFRKEAQRIHTTLQAGMGAPVTPPAPNAGPKPGDVVTVGGKRIKITKVFADGTFDGDPQ